MKSGTQSFLQKWAPIRFLYIIKKKEQEEAGREVYNEEK